MLLFIDKPAGVDLSDKPILEDLKRCETPKIVTESDLKETKEDFQNLMFNHETEVGNPVAHPERVHLNPSPRPRFLNIL